MSDNVPPFDLQIEIMKRFPIKSLMKFRSVSKQWKSVIQSSRFITDYNSAHNQQLIVGYQCDGNYAYIYNDDETFPEYKSRLPFPSSVKLFINSRYVFQMDTIIGCSQGLFGFCNYGSNMSDTRVVIWNPCIRKSVNIPVPNGVLDWPYGTVFGFGVCNATDPMIVKINYTESSKYSSTSNIQSHVEVFKLSTGVWRSLSNTPRKSLKLTSTVVVIDRFIYWIAKGRHQMGDSLILSFDMISEVFSEIYLPDWLAGTRYRDFGLSKLKESLVVLEDLRYHPKREVGVWIKMPDDDIQSSFKKLYTIKLPNDPILSVIGFRESGQPIVQTINSSYRRKFLFYEPESERFSDNWIDVDQGQSIVGTCIESLLLLDYDGGI